MKKPGKSQYTSYLSEHIISRVVGQPKRLLEHSGFVLFGIPTVESSANGWPAICIIVSAIPVDCPYQNPNWSLLFSVLDMKCSNRRAVIRYTTHFRKLKWSRNRIQYYANSSCVFNHILNCGDIVTNPGPPSPEPTTDENNSISNSVQNLCPTCNQNVIPIAGLFSDLCNYSWHVKWLSFPRDRLIHTVSSHT